MSEFDKIFGYDEIKKELIYYCDVIKNPERYRKLGVKIPSGILLEGDPGLGKTLMAKCFIEESGCKTFILRKNKPDGDFVKEIKDVYEKAKAEEKAIVFLDDMDKFANSDEDHPNAEEYVTIQTCIDESKEHGVFTISTVNDMEPLPYSLLRVGRFDKIIHIYEPVGEDFQKILTHFMSERLMSNDIDFEEICRLMEHNSCAELETIINDAGIYAGFDGRDHIEHRDLVKACLRSLFGASESYKFFSDETKRVISIHEAGHAVVAEILDPGSVNAVSILSNRSVTGGITLYKYDAENDTSIKKVENAIMRSLGGKAANELVNGIADIGCNRDLRTAYHKVSYLVGDCCAYGFDSFANGDDSNHLRENKDRRIASVVEDYYKKVKNILGRNVNFLNAVTDELLEKETLTFRDIQRIKTSINHPIINNGV